MKSTANGSWLTIQETADELKVCPRTVRRYIASGRLRASRLGPRSIRISSQDVDALLRHIPTVGDAA